METLGEMISKVFGSREETNIAQSLMNEDILKSIQESIKTYAKVINEKRHIKILF